MKASSILIVRPWGLHSGFGRNQNPSRPSFCPESGMEFLFLDISGDKGAPTGIVLKEQVPQKTGEAFALTLETAIISFIQTHGPGMVLILKDETDGAGWDEALAQAIRKSVPGLRVYAGPTPSPLVSRICLGETESGQALSGAVAFRAGQGVMEKGVDKLVDILKSWIEETPGKVTFSLHLPVGPDMDYGPIEASLAHLFENGLSMVHWEMTGKDGRLPKDLLWKVSKQGIWNHVSGRQLFDPDHPDGSWILNTPNIVHSFEDVDAVSPDAGVRPPLGLLSYGKLPGLPGRPFWQVLRDPLLLLPWLGQMPQKQVLRMRVDEATGGIFGIGNGITYFFEKPDQIPGDLMDEIIDMVDAGGSVDITHVRDNLKKAYLIGYAMENGCVIGNSSLKHPRQVFIDRLKGMTGLDFTHCVERGYTSVRPEYRAMGIGAKLLEGLTARAVDVKVFSIISEDNLATQKIAIRNNTRKITTYFSDKLKKDMGVWMPEHMITKEWEPDK